MTWVLAVTILVYLAGVNMALDYYPQAIDWDSSTRVGKVLLFALIALWPLTEFYQLAIEKIFGKE